MPSSSRWSRAEEAPAVSPALKVAVVARRLGVAPATLRTWARRYGLGPSAHVAGAHRQYSADDLARLMVMRRLTLQGVAPAEAARLAVGTRAEDDTEPGPGRVPAQPRHPAFEELVGDDRVDFGRAGGGQVVALPSSGPAARGLARAAMGLDGAACLRVLEVAIERDGVVVAWEELARPVLAALGRRWEATGAGVDVEHLLSEALLSSLRAASAGERRRSSATALVACAEEEMHSLAVHVLAAALDERGVTARVLGARVPRQALCDAVRRSGPAAVVVHATMPVNDAGALADLPRLRPAPRLLVGGPGWAGVRLPRGVHQVTSLAEAVDQVALAVLP